MSILLLALRQMRREWRGGELIILLASLTVAAAAVSTVGFLANRVGQAMRVSADAALAADLDIRGPTPLPAVYAEIAASQGLSTTPTIKFPSVILNGDRSQLADIHVVAPGYPLRGSVKLAAVPFGPSHPASAIPAEGTIWAAPKLLTSLGAKVGDTLQVGASRLKVAAVLAYAPGNGIDFIEFAPSLFMNTKDLAAAQLVQRGSRVGYHLLIAGTAPQVEAYRAAVQPKLRETDRIVDINDTRPEVRNPLSQGENFLRLAALVAVLVAAVAVGMAAREYATRRTDEVAVLLTLGMRRNRLTVLLLLQLLLLGITGAIIGSAIGYGVQYGLVRVFGGLLPVALPPPGWSPVLTAFGTIVLLLMGFALTPVLRLRNTPPARILRRDLGPRPANALVIWGAALAALIALLAWQTSDLRLTLYVFGGLAGTALVLALGAWLLLWALTPLRKRVGTAWRFGLGNLHRRGGHSVVQVAAFGLGLTVLLWLTVVRADVFRAWHNTLPPNMPNQFIFNIQPNDIPTLRDFFAGHKLPAPTLYSMTRGRLVGINGKHVTAADFKNERARHLLNREANISDQRFLRSENHITAGQWWDHPEPGAHLISVDDEIAAALGVKPGDSLTFAIGGDEVTLKVANLRKIDWQTFQPNFFFVTPPGLLYGYPTTFITSIHLTPQQAPALVELVRTLPGITIVDVGTIISTVQQIIEEASLAVACVFGFTLFAGILVLWAAVHATRIERRYESALLRTLGASRSIVFKGIIAEFAMLGLLAGSLGGAAALGVGYWLTSHIFSLPYHPDPWIVPLGLGGGLVVITLTGVAATRRAISRPPVQTLMRHY